MILSQRRSVFKNKLKNGCAPTQWQMRADVGVCVSSFTVFSQ